MSSTRGPRGLPQGQDKDRHVECGYRIPCLTARPRRKPQGPQMPQELLDPSSIPETLVPPEPQQQLSQEPQGHDTPCQVRASEERGRSETPQGFQECIPESVERDHGLCLLDRYADRLLAVFGNRLRRARGGEPRGGDFLATAVAEESLPPPPYPGHPMPTQTAPPLTGVDEVNTSRQPLVEEEDEEVEVKYLYTVPDAAENLGPVSPLTTLPRELLLQIMQLLPPGSLWSFRQSSPLFFRLFNKRPTFREWHTPPGPIDRYVRFKVETIKKPERDGLAKLLQRDNQATWNLSDTPETYCASCIEVMSRGENHSAKMKLRETRYCDGCKQRHLCVFFPADSITRCDNDVITELYCVGRIGTATICSHESVRPLTWRTLENALEGTSRRHTLVCDDAQHEPCHKDRRTPNHQLLAYPGLTVNKRYKQDDNFHFNLTLAWDRPLLDIDAEYPPTLRAVQNTLAKLIDNALVQHKPCRHMADGQQLRAFAHAGICRCFCDPSIKKRVPRALYLSKTKDGCGCRRKQYLMCRECAATYSWHLEHGRITLSYRYEWQVMYPTSPAWINLLDQSPEELGMLTEDTRHLLWCDRPGCATGMGRRWEEMLKEAIWLQHRLYGTKPDKDVDYSKAWEILSMAHWLAESRRRDNDFYLGGFELSPHLVRSSWCKEGSLLASQIEKAAIAAQERG